MIKILYLIGLWITIFIIEVCFELILQAFGKAYDEESIGTLIRATLLASGITLMMIATI